MAVPLVPVLLAAAAAAFVLTRKASPAQAPAPTGPQVIVKHGDPPTASMAVGQQLQVVEPTLDWTPGIFVGVSNTMNKDDGKSPLMMLATYGGPGGKVFVFKAMRPGQAGLNLVSSAAGQSDAFTITVLGS